MITIIKLDVRGEVKARYQGEVIERSEHALVIQAHWAMPARDLGYTQFEPGDRFTEYYYSDRWFNIFDISNSEGVRKGWYCNIAEPAHFLSHTIEQVDLLLDVWVDPLGQAQVLDENEFIVATLREEQRVGAQEGLQALLRLLQARAEPFIDLAGSPVSSREHTEG